MHTHTYILWWWHIFNYLWSMDRCWKVYTVLQLCKLYFDTNTCFTNYALLRYICTVHTYVSIDRDRNLSNRTLNVCLLSSFLIAHFKNIPLSLVLSSSLSGSLYIDKNVTKFNFLPNTFKHSIDFVRLCYKHLSSKLMSLMINCKRYMYKKNRRWQWMTRNALKLKKLIINELEIGTRNKKPNHFIGILYHHHRW